MPDPLLVAPVALGRILAEYAHLAARARSIALEDLDRGGLAGPVGTQQAEHLAALDREGQPAYGLERAVRLAQVGDFDGG